MSTRTADYREIIDLLSPGAILVLQDVSRDEYELVELSHREGQKKALAAFRQWLKTVSREPQT
jgi:hypothetical protein